MPRPHLPLLAILIVCALLTGCSERATRLVGNERLIRGGGGFGTTAGADTVVDRDTYVSPRTAFNEATLLVAKKGAYEARTLFRFGSWSVQDTTNSIDSILFEIDYDATIGIPTSSLPIELRTAAEVWDSTTVAWPGPAPGDLLGSADPFVQTLNPLRINLGASAEPLVRGWAANPDSMPGFVLLASGGNDIAGFKAGTARFRIVAHKNVSGVTSSDTTRVKTDLTIHTPVTPAPTGSETTLHLGGLFRTEAALRAPVPAPPEGFSVNEAHFVVYLGSPAPPSAQTFEIQVFRNRKDWTEGALADTTLGPDAAPLAVLKALQFTGPGDSIEVPVPASVAREWLANPAVNYGVLLRVKEAYLWDEILLLSRESSSPPVLRIGITSPPPGRF